MAAPIITLEAVSKHFPGVRALERVNLELHAGEVHVLLGENGAGKSTLMKILAGVHQPDSGRILLDGAPVKLMGPRMAQALGIATIYQELSLVPDLTVAENLYLGRTKTRYGMIDFGSLNREAAQILEELQIPVAPSCVVRGLSVAQMQMIEIARALTQRARILTLDEPTAALSEKESEVLFATVRKLRDRGVALVYISHRMPELFELGDRVTVLRDGCSVATKPIRESTPDDLIRLMVGRELSDVYPPQTPLERDELALEVTNLNRPGVLFGVSFSLRRGEILGIAGLVGSGRTELLRALFRADSATGEVRINGEFKDLRNPRQAVEAGLAFLTEDRKHQGLALGMRIRENVVMACLKRFFPVGFWLEDAERQASAEYIERLAIRTPSAEQRVVNLSGGNQQKVVLAKWLLCDAKILLIDEPTRGIDIGARAEIYALMRQLTAQGKSIVMVSSDLPEVLGMSDRILVMGYGRVMGELKRSEASQESILQLATKE